MARDSFTWLVTGLISATASIASATVLTVGAGGDYSDIDSALTASGAGDTIRFVDSAVYSPASFLSITGKNNLTIESAAGQRATISFTGASGHGIYLNSSGVTFKDLDMTTTRDGALMASNPATGTNATITGVNFSRTVGLGNYGSAGLVETTDGMSISYSTFRGEGDMTINRGWGISWSGGTTVTVNHSSFDNLYLPINNPAGSGTTGITVTNSAFGRWHPAGWAGAIGLADGVPTVSENYNAAHGSTYDVSPMVYNPGGASVTSGANSFWVDNYGDLFVGDTAADNWEVAPALYTAASDGTTIGAWQAVPEPAALSLIALGALALGGRRRR